MKKYLFCLLPFCCMASEYEFLTPQTAVLKGVEHRVLSPRIVKRGIWRKECGLQRDFRGRILRKPHLVTYQYLVLKTPLKAGEKFEAGGMALQYDPEKPTGIFKFNQVGNGATQKRKYAYMGAWLGSAGALPLKHLAGKNFELRRSSDNRCVYKNILKLRREDPLYQGRIPFTGEEVLELDYSSFSTPGEYYFYVEGIGRSRTFIIGPEALSEAFYIHARGLYHKRCGIAGKMPFTAWERPVCHRTALRGRFPGNAGHYRKGKGEKDFGFFDRKGRRLDVRHFELIKDNPPYKREKVFAPGGWHDAADYDRRPFHLRIVSDLATVYLLKPQNFIDGQLNIPESGNNIPDILDEAMWGVKHLLAVQQSDGGVGTWFETTGHPGPGEGLPDKDRRIYFISAPSRNGTLEYAAAAGILALAMKKAGAHREAALLRRSAERAWDFAADRKKRLVAWFRLKGKIVSYMEEPHLEEGTLLRAGVTLFALTGRRDCLEFVLDAKTRIKEAFKKEFWRWSVLSWMPLELFPVKELEEFRQEYRKVICRNGDQMLKEQENAYPFRTLWHGADAGWVHAMAWGNYHPLRRAMTLIAAYALTGKEKYLDGACLANDFHNGANPLGRSMTSGLGKIYPAVFLDLISYADTAGEFVPGITPYGNTFGIDRNGVKMVYQQHADDLPLFRRYVNLEFLSVPSSEYSVWETIAPAAAVTGFLLEKPILPPKKWMNRKPAQDFRKLPGYLALP